MHTGAQKMQHVSWDIWIQPQLYKSLGLGFNNDGLLRVFQQGKRMEYKIGQLSSMDLSYVDRSS